MTKKPVVLLPAGRYNLCKEVVKGISKNGVTVSLRKVEGRENQLVIITFKEESEVAKEGGWG